MSNSITAFKKAAGRFYEVFASFNENQVNRIPFENSWTPAQVVDHILKSQSTLPGLLSGESRNADRNPESNKETIQKIFLDFSTKLQSPQFILPTTEPQDKQQLLEAIKEKSNNIIHAMYSNDITRIFTGYELPVLGQLTGIEWGWFSGFHVQRHTHQLENMYQQMNKSSF